MNSLRQQLEAVLIASKGEINIPDAAAIQTAVKWERHGALCLRWLRLEGNKMTCADKLRFSEAIAKASTNRDKAIAHLHLGVKVERPWLELAARVVEAEDD